MTTLGANQLWGRYRPGTTVVHRLPPGLKMAMVVLLGGLCVALRWWPASVTLVLVAAMLVLLSGVGITEGLRLPWLVWFGIAVPAMYPLFFGNPLDAVVTAGNLLGTLWLARMLTLTTAPMQLLDALVAAARPLDWTGIGSERFALAVMIMVNAVPHLLAALDHQGQLLRARRVNPWWPGNWPLRLAPVVIEAVAHAQAMARAMAARGLGEARRSGSGSDHAGVHR